MRLRCALLAFVFLVAPAHAHAAKLNINDIFGLWVGSCTQTETGTQSVIGADISLQGKLIFVDWTTANGFFGCPAESPGSYVLSKGGGRSGYSPHSLHVKTAEPVDPFGKVSIKTAGTKFSVKGSNACNGAGPSTYKGKGTLTGSIFSFQMSAKMQGETIHFTCSWTRHII